MDSLARLLPLLALLSCSFPDFKVQERLGAGGTSMEVLPSCHDGERNGDETSVDCGILACGVACEVGEGCDGVEDCDGGACLKNVCQAPACDDELLNGTETDVDCGGEVSCARCVPGQRCRNADDCDGGLCTGGLCRAPSCNDGVQNAEETDVDCGGPTCASCEEGKSCLVTSDCDNVACEKGKCQPRGCADGVKNQDETDVDCGGSCPSPCADDLRCKVAADCESGVCSKQTLRCSAARCDDGVLNGSEPTIDCGASCSDKCQVLDRCTVAQDCESLSCVAKVCLPTTPTNDIYLMQGWIATASHEHGSSTSAAKAIDGSLATDWITGTAQIPGMWLQVDMRERKVVFSVELVINDVADAGDAPEAVDVWLSDDGTFTAPVVKNRAGAQSTRIDFASPQVAQYVRVSLSAGVSKDKWWRVDELRVRQ